MKFLTIAIFFLSLSLGFGQEKKKIDERLFTQFEQNKIEKISKERPDYYNYLVFQLDNSFEFVSQKEAKKNTSGPILYIKTITGELMSDNQLNTPKFNWFELPITQQKFTDSYFLTKEGNYVKLISQKALKDKFLNSGLNSK